MAANSAGAPALPGLPGENGSRDPGHQADPRQLGHQPAASGAHGMAEEASAAAAEVDVAAELRFFLRPAHRHGPVTVPCDGFSTLGHVVQSLGVPLTEVGALIVNGARVEPGYRLADGDQVRVDVVRRPQLLAEPRFVLDVHLGTLA